MNPIASDYLGDRGLWSRPSQASRRRFLAMSLGLGIEASLIGAIRGREARRPRSPEVHQPFSPARTVVLPRRLGRRHIRARHVTERRVEELAAMDLWRLPEPKIDALLQVADAVTCHYGLADQLETWAVRIPVQEAFSPYSSQHWSLLNHWQPWEPVPGARSPVDRWLFLSPGPIDWGSLDDLPVHIIVAHVAPTDYRRQMSAMLAAWSQAAKVLATGANSNRPWPDVARMRPIAAIRRLNQLASQAREQDA